MPAGKTLTLTGTNATNKLTVTVENGATLDVKGGESAATLDVTVKAGGVMNVPNGKLIDVYKRQQMTCFMPRRRRASGMSL